MEGTSIASDCTKRVIGSSICAPSAAIDPKNSSVLIINSKVEIINKERVVEMIGSSINALRAPVECEILSTSLECPIVEDSWKQTLFGAPREILMKYKVANG